MKITYYSIIEESNIDKLETRINKIMKEDKDSNVQPLGGVSFNPKNGKVYQVLVDVEEEYVPSAGIDTLDDVNDTLKKIVKLLEAQQNRGKGSF